MMRKYRGLIVIAAIIITAEVIGILAYLVHGHTVAVLQPQGVIAEKQRNLMLTASLMMLIVIVPVFAMAFGFAWRYRDRGDKHTAKYTPDWSSNRKLETIWWGIPIILIGILSVIAWKSSHSLDPYRPIASPKPAITVQVVALDWKWLFIYPEQHIASVNFVEFPANTPIHFKITSDAPMNSFWIPQLGGQVYAMSGMQTQLSLMANKPGAYDGSSANISGKGFAGMRFVAKAVSADEFQDWVDTVRATPDTLNHAAYDTLAKPSQNNQLTYYGNVDSDLFESVMMKYMAPQTKTIEGTN